MTLINKIDKNNSKDLQYFNNFFNKIIIKEYSSYNNNLSELHKFVPTKKINELRLKIFNKLNKNFDWMEKIKSLAIADIIPIIGPDILIQSKINVSIQMPDDKSSILPIHADAFSGESPFQINLWIPLTNCFDSNAMFILDEKITMKYVKNMFNKDNKSLDINKIKVGKKNFQHMQFGEILIFNPGLLHGNILNNTNKTRISMNVRLKALLAPESEKTPDRKYGTFYKKFNLSENTQFAFNYLSSNLYK